MLIKNLPPRAGKSQIRDASVLRATFLRDKFAAISNINNKSSGQIGKIVRTPKRVRQESNYLTNHTTNEPVQSLPINKEYQTSQGKHVSFDDNYHVTIIPESDNFENSYANAEAHRKLENVNYETLSVSKKDILLEKEIGIIKMMEYIDSEKTQNNEEFAEQGRSKEIDTSENERNLESVQIKKERDKSKITTFSSKWMDEWDEVTVSQKSIVYTQIANERIVLPIKEYNLQPPRPREQNTMSNKKQTSFLYDSNKKPLQAPLLITNLYKPKPKGKLLNELMATYTKIKGIRPGCK